MGYFALMVGALIWCYPNYPSGDFIFIMILYGHLMGDWIFQTGDMATTKSEPFGGSGALADHGLVRHISVYTLWMMIISPLYGLINGLIHGIIDYHTSRLTKKYYSLDRDKFFGVIGIDQFLHMVTLYVTYRLMF